jgi:hypothetical protein
VDGETGNKENPDMRGGDRQPEVVDATLKALQHTVEGHLPDLTLYKLLQERHVLGRGRDDHDPSSAGYM